MSHNTIKLIIKILAAILGVLASWFGVSCVTSCTVTRTSDIQDRAVIVTVDTTVVDHYSTIKFPKQ